MITSRFEAARALAARLAALLAAFLLLAACQAEVVTFTPETPAEREVRESREALQRTIGEGGLFGAGAGAVVGGLAGGVGGAFQGAQAGRLVGSTAGAYVRQLQASYAAEEDLLDQVLRDVRATNARMEASLRALRNAVAEAERRGPDPVRDARLADEAEATAVVAERQLDVFLSTRSLLVADGVAVDAPSAGIAPELSRLQQRVASLRRIADGISQ